MNTTHKCTYARRGLDGLAQIGPSKFDLRGIRLVEGELGAPTTPPTPTAPATTTPPTAPPAPAAPPASSTSPWGDDPSKFDQDKA